MCVHPRAACLRRPSAADPEEFLFVLDLGFDIVDRVTRLDTQGNDLRAAFLRDSGAADLEGCLVRQSFVDGLTGEKEHTRHGDKIGWQKDNESLHADISCINIRMNDSHNNST